jgi:glycosyltransferase involved in cell wall biosynthesis
VPSERIFLSYYGVDVDATALGNGEGRLRSELRLAPDQQVVGMVAYMYAPKRFLGQTTGLKGHEDFIDALALLLGKMPRLVGFCIGGAWNGAVRYEERVKARGKARCGDRLQFLGTRDDVHELYAGLDVAVHPSHSENVGGAAESLLYGVPTVATNVGGFPDVVIRGETGWLVPPRAPERLADAIAEALDDPSRARRYAEQGRAMVRSLLDVRQNAREVIAVYHAALAAVPAGEASAA